MTFTVRLFFEALTVATGLGAIAVRWNGSRYSERARTPFSWSGVPELSWDHCAEIGSAAQRSRAKLTEHTLYAIAALLSTAAIASSVAVAHTGSRLILVVAASIMACFFAGALALRVRQILLLRLSRAREAFDRFYVGTGLCKYENVESGLARFALEHPRAYRIAHRSLIVDQKAGAAERERQAQAYAAAIERALA